MKIFCRIGLHSLVRSAAFERTCECCGAVYHADYFEWRAKGYPVWKRTA